MCSLPSVTKLRMKKSLELEKSEVIIVESSKIKVLKLFLMKIAFLMIALVLELLNKTEL